jgi:hypothetical protein
MKSSRALCHARDEAGLTRVTPYNGVHRLILWFTLPMAYRVSWILVRVFPALDVFELCHVSFNMSTHILSEIQRHVSWFSV